MKKKIENIRKLTFATGFDALSQISNQEMIHTTNFTLLSAVGTP